MVEYSIEDFFRWLQRIKKEFEDDEYDTDVWCEIFDELRYEDCEKYEKRLDEHDG